MEAINSKGSRNRSEREWVTGKHPSSYRGRGLEEGIHPSRRGCDRQVPSMASLLSRPSLSPPQWWISSAPSLNFISDINMPIDRSKNLNGWEMEVDRSWEDLGAQIKWEIWWVLWPLPANAAVLTQQRVVERERLAWLRTCLSLWPRIAFYVVICCVGTFEN